MTTIQEALEEYNQALKKGQKEYKEAAANGRMLYPMVLDDMLPENNDYPVLDIGLVDIPMERIVGVKTAGRVSAFSTSFLPLLEPKTEFGNKWIHLCISHMDEGIRDPIACYEYLGNFYIQEGNKRVSVLRHFGAPLVSGTVKRILPPLTDSPRVQAYYEFLEFYKASRIYRVQFRRPGQYAWLTAKLGKKPGEPWTEDERRTFRSYFHYFQEAFEAQDIAETDVLPEEALLVWLHVYTYQDLGKMTTTQLKKSLAAIWDDVLVARESSVKVQTKAEDESKGSLMGRLVSNWDQLNVAFVHQLNAEKSDWVQSHEEGRKFIEDLYDEKIVVRSYFDANTPEQCEALIEQAVADGADVVFTTSPPLSRATLKAAVKYPKVRFLNCSVDQAYSSIRTYYGRIYEAKFITGAIAGAVAGNDRIGYITSYPIYGVPASINAFALGAQMTNPRALIEVRWSCLPGTPQEDFLDDGIRVVSNRSVPTQSRNYDDFCSYGTYLMNDQGSLIPLGTPVWVWGKFYEFVLESIFSGGWKREKGVATAVNYWLGMDSGVIDVKFSDKLPEGVRHLAKILRKSMQEGVLDPFKRRIVAQDGTVKNDGDHVFTPEELLHMDWLCENVIGSIPPFEEILPASQDLVRRLGIYKDKIPPEKEGTSQ